MPRTVLHLLSAFFVGAASAAAGVAFYATCLDRHVDEARVVPAATAAVDMTDACAGEDELLSALPAEVAEVAPAPAPALPPVPFEVFVHPDVDPEQPLPMVLALHGRGGSPQWFIRRIKKLRVPVRWVIPQAPRASGAGYAWLSRAPRHLERERLVDELTRASDQLAAMLPSLTERYPTDGRPIVVGFSQGAMVAWSLAVRHPEQIELAVPIAGFLPEPVGETSRDPAGARPRVIALHGRWDDRVEIGAARSSAKRATRLGVPVELRVHAEAGHQFTPRMRRELRRILDGELANVGA